MTIEQAILENLRELPPEKQQEVLHFVQSLTNKTSLTNRRSIKGLCADLGVHLTKEDIDEARREMWGKFSREDF
ncbi:hypothetical protein NIES4071_61140 [Calothrix sp. NIES-4071]|nr:hypothetical protein NIES4071_61140 [Calothrix sp. NIES-4071]BAZ60421.1 hypothetical protein NIES4105_61090 [Calothrix sp. NIES-4105]